MTFSTWKTRVLCKKHADAKRVFSELADTLLLQKEMEQRVDQHRQSFPCFDGSRHTGSGKSYAIVNNYIKQQIEKGFAMYIYDYKFPTSQRLPTIICSII